MMYGHLDKQPEFSGWRSDLGPWNPVYQDGKLYGRGGADDGYAAYAAIAAIQALKTQKVPHPRIIGLIEDGTIDTRPWITHRLSFKELPAAFPGLLGSASGVIKAVVEMSS
jgi:hypothetical protein